ncbi:MAG TPA: hypothetical protein VH370_24875 [Humisphaera sp.]|jgi:hypothetical protein|nr:hypothetical protein [Humisphaera sp.]
MREGKVYVCKWEKLPDGRVRGVVAKPDLRIDAESIDELTQEFTEAIAHSTGDCEPVIEYEPTVIEGGPPDYFKENLIELSTSSHFRFDGVKGLVEGGCCPRCGWPMGGRTNNALAVDSMWPGELSFSWDPAAEGVHLLIASERFLGLLSASDRKAFNVRPVTRPPKARKRYFEIVPKQFVATVTIRSLTQSGWFCQECSRSYISHSDDLGVPAISRAGIPATSLFFVGHSTHFSLCMKFKRWQQLKSALRAVAISSGPIAVVEPHETTDEVRVPEIEAKRLQFSRRR